MGGHGDMGKGRGHGLRSHSLGQRAYFVVFIFHGVLQCLGLPWDGGANEDQVDDAT